MTIEDSIVSTVFSFSLFLSYILHNNLPFNFVHLPASDDSHLLKQSFYFQSQPGHISLISTVDSQIQRRLVNWENGIRRPISSFLNRFLLLSETWYW